MAKKYTHNGTTESISGWARISGINYDTLRYRLVILGWGIGDALSSKAGDYATKYTNELTNKSLTLSEWAKRTGIPRGTLVDRINRGWPVHKTMSTPIQGRVTDKYNKMTEAKLVEEYNKLETIHIRLAAFNRARTTKYTRERLAELKVSMEHIRDILTSRGEHL